MVNRGLIESIEYFLKISIKAMSNLNKEFYKISGSICGIMAWIIGLLSFTIAIILRSNVDSTFSLNSHYLCDLGIEKYDTHIVFSIGFILNKSFLIPFYISFGFLLQKKIYKSYLIRVAIVTSIISMLSLIILPPFLLDPYNQFFCSMHGILGFIHFSSATFAFTLYGIIELSNPRISSFYAIVSFITAFMHGFFLIFSSIHLIEWFTISSDFIWVLIHTIFLFKSDQTQVQNIVIFELDYLLKYNRRVEK